MVRDHWYPSQVLTTLRTALNFLLTEELQDGRQLREEAAGAGAQAWGGAADQEDLQACDKSPQDEHFLNHDEYNHFDICAASFVPIYKGRKCETASILSAKYMPEFKGQVCRVDGVSQIGKGVQVN